MNESFYSVSTESGREIRVMVSGQPNGVPVLVHHGTPGSTLLYPPWVEDAQRRGIRLISYERPGYGGSTSHPGRSVASAAEDVATIAKQLGLDRLSVWGGSGGGPHALACAALLPELIVAAAAYASPAPYPADGLDWFAGMAEDNIEEFRTALDGRGPLEQSVEAQAPGLVNADPRAFVQAFRSLLSPADAAVMTEDLASFLIDHLREGIQDRRDGWIDDDIAFVTPWGFELTQIRIPVLLMHGEQDWFVPFSHGEWLASRIANVDARFSADDGHLTLSALRVPEIHAWLLDKLQ